MAKKIKKSLGEMLLDSNMLTPQQWEQAQKETQAGESVPKVLARLGLVSEGDMVDFLAQQMEIPRIDLNNHLIDAKVIQLIPEDLARKYQLIPILKIGNTLTCTMADVFNILALDEVSLKTGLIVKQAISTEEEVRKALDEHYAVAGGVDDIIQELDEQNQSANDEEEMDLHKLKDMGEEAPVIKLVNMTVMQAVREKASDVHIEPEEESLKIRFRIDGVLHEEQAIPKHLQAAIISRIKILSNLDIAERRKPQDGRFQLTVDQKQIDVRVSCMPTIYGENIVMRLLDRSSVLLSLAQIGFQREMLVKYEGLLGHANGIILVTGPTGGGKTTTLYSSLSKINTPDKNIVTIEDPVEYRLKGINQTQINLSVDLTFANGLRTILRQDPDVIMVGEIRDLETAEIAIQAALTGHLVLATLHTNDAPGAVARLIDMGIEPFLISSALIGVVAQRLVRLLCPSCKGDGCKECYQSGFKGRMGIYELMVVDDKIRAEITKKSTSEEIRKVAISSGMQTLYDDGMQKVKDSITTEKEIMRVIQEG